jgi:hypothetical protein
LSCWSFPFVRLIMLHPFCHICNSFAMILVPFSYHFHVILAIFSYQFHMHLASSLVSFHTNFCPVFSYNLGYMMISSNSLVVMNPYVKLFISVVWWVASCNVLSYLTGISHVVRIVTLRWIHYTKLFTVHLYDFCDFVLFIVVLSHFCCWFIAIFGRKL